MMNDKATIYLTSLVGFGAVVLTLITTFLHTTLIGYMVILMLFCTVIVEWPICCSPRYKYVSNLLFRY